SSRLRNRNGPADGLPLSAAPQSELRNVAPGKSRASVAKDGTGHGEDRRRHLSGHHRPLAGGRRARVTMSAPSQPAAELTIGIVGTHDLVEKIMLSGPLAGPAGPAEQTVPARRLIAAAYRDEQEAADRVTRLGPGIDVCLFASKVPYGYARKAGVISSPATYIALGGGALYAALLRACLTGRHDLTRASVDVLSRSAVDEAMAEIGVPASQVHVQDEPGTPAALAAFHERLWRAGRTSVAFTCLRSVAARLSAARVPVYPVSPTGPAIRSALRTAALLGANRRLEAAQPPRIVVEGPGL